MPRPSREGVLTAAELEIRRCYCAIRSRIPTVGVQATLLQVGDERTGVVTGNDAAPQAVLMLEIGSCRVAREHFRHLSPTEAELEGAIATIEDEVARAGPMLNGNVGCARAGPHCGHWLATEPEAERTIALNTVTGLLGRGLGGRYDGGAPETADRAAADRMQVA